MTKGADVKDRIALVTGAGRGIGRAIALGLAREGAKVAITARTQSQLTDVAGEIEAAGSQALNIAADLSHRHAPREVIDRVVQQWGPIEILVNNAGIGSSADPKPLIDFDDDFWDLTMEVNVRAPYVLTKLVLPPMMEAGWGRIVNVASINAKVAAMHGSAYAASKHALAGLTKATALEMAPHGITANAVCPGLTATEMNDKRIQYEAQRLGTTTDEIEKNASPMGRRMQPEEIATLAVYLASDGASGITGQLINVCGGRVMS
jgi:NAD(P)-dependent dehydrogenase (short-subunit alcohol dehydrogenase family)